MTAPKRELAAVRHIAEVARDLPELHLTTDLINRYLAGMSLDLDEVAGLLAKDDAQLVELREDHTQAYARAYLSSEGTVEERKQQALLATVAERTAVAAAELVIRGRKQQIKTLESRIDVGRSLGAALRSEISLGGYGGAA